MFLHTVRTPSDSSGPTVEAKACPESPSKEQVACVSSAAPPTPQVTNPAIDVRLLQEVLQPLQSQASYCRPRNFPTASYPTPPRSSGRTTAIGDGRLMIYMWLRHTTLMLLGEAPEYRDVFFMRSRYRPEAVNDAPSIALVPSNGGGGGAARPRSAFLYQSGSGPNGTLSSCNPRGLP